ncbi:hypothetical protein D3C81_1377660 [compost metagenome]
MEEFEFADSFDSEQTMDQQDWVAGVCIPLHVRTFSQQFVGGAVRFTLKHSTLVGCMKSPLKTDENGIDPV